MGNLGRRGWHAWLKPVLDLLEPRVYDHHCSSCGGEGVYPETLARAIMFFDAVVPYQYPKPSAVKLSEYSITLQWATGHDGYLYVALNLDHLGADYGERLATSWNEGAPLPEDDDDDDGWSSGLDLMIEHITDYPPLKNTEQAIQWRRDVAAFLRDNQPRIVPEGAAA